MARAICSGPSLPPDSHMIPVTTTDAVSAAAIHRATGGLSVAGSSAQLMSSVSCTPAATSLPAIDSCSRRSSSEANSATASCLCGNVGRSSRRCQPSGERRFSGARACDRQQLEQRTMAEQVEVVRVEVVVIAKAIAWLARARPAVLDSSQAAFVERDGPRRLVTLTNHPLVPADKDDEGGDGRTSSQLLSTCCHAATAMRTPNPNTPSRA